jgi:hypothetical protein
MSKRLVETDYINAATRLGVDVAAVKAVAEVESRNGGFLLSGEPVILFERHWMHRLLRKKGITPPQNSPVAMIKAGGYLGGTREHKRLQEAALIDRECALMSCSWGLFQIMGFHWEFLGYPSLQAFINAMYKDEASQMDAFIRFIENYTGGKLHKALKEHDWAKFSFIYNGPAYKKYSYDSKIAAAYNKFNR